MEEKISRQDLLHLSFYKKTHYSGSFRGMRYRIEKYETPHEEGEKGELFLRAWYYPEPYSFEKTDSELKGYKDFPFAEESIDLAKEWLDEQYEKGKSMWENVPKY